MRDCAPRDVVSPAFWCRLQCARYACLLMFSLRQRFLGNVVIVLNKEFAVVRSRT